MAGINMIPENEADGELADFYNKYKSRRTGLVDHILKVHSLDPPNIPPTMMDHIQIYRRLMH